MKNQLQTQNYAFATSTRTHFPKKMRLDDLIGDLDLTKSGAELQTFRLREWNLLGEDCNCTAHVEFSVYLTVDDNLCYCKNVSVPLLQSE